MFTISIIIMILGLNVTVARKKNVSGAWEKGEHRNFTQGSSICSGRETQKGVWGWGAKERSLQLIPDAIRS